MLPHPRKHQHLHPLRPWHYTLVPSWPYSCERHTDRYLSPRYRSSHCPLQCNYRMQYLQCWSRYWELSRWSGPSSRQKHPTQCWSRYPGLSRWSDPCSHRMRLPQCWSRYPGLSHWLGLCSHRTNGLGCALHCHQSPLGGRLKKSPHPQKHNGHIPQLPWHCSIPPSDLCNQRIPRIQYWSHYCRLLRWSGLYSQRIDSSGFSPRHLQSLPADRLKMCLRAQKHSGQRSYIPNPLLPWHCSTLPSGPYSHRMHSPRYWSRRFQLSRWSDPCSPRTHAPQCWSRYHRLSHWPGAYSL